MKILAVILFVLISIQTNAQNILSGKIIDQESKEALVGVHIYIPDLQKGTTTDSEGSYEIKDLPLGNFLIEISYLSYSSKTLRVSLDQSTTLNIELSATASNLSEIVVTGTSSSTNRAQNPTPIISLRNIQSKNIGSNNIVDALSSQPGIDQITTGGAVSKPIIRGLGYNRVVVLNNNIRQEGQQWGDEHGVEIDAFSIDRIEVIKGPGSLMYGSDALAGVIHFLSPKAVDEGKIIANLVTNYQSNNNLLAGSFMTAGNIKGIHWLARISGKLAGNYANSLDGKVYNSGFEEMNVNANLGINKKWGYTQLQFSSFNQRLGLIEGERNASGSFIRTIPLNDSTVEEQVLSPNELSNYSIDIPRQKINHLKIASSSKFFIKNSSLSLNLAFQQNSRKEFEDPLEPSAAELFFLLNTFNYGAKYLLPEFKGWQLSVGINGMQQSNFNKGEVSLIPEYNLFDFGAFVFVQKSFKKLHLSGGVRFDVRHINSLPLYLNQDNEPTDVLDSNSSVKFKAFSKTFSNISAALGGSYNFTKEFILKLNFARGFRTPNIAELGSNGIHEGTFRYEQGNNSLVPETSFQIDLGLLYRGKHFSMEAAFFYNNIQNYIFLQKLRSSSGTDSIVDVSDPAPVFQFTQNNAHLFGGELAINIHPSIIKWLQFNNSFSFVRGEQFNAPDSTKFLPFMPAPKIQSELAFQFKKASPFFQNINIRINVAHTFEQNNIFFAYDTETKTPAYTLLNASLGFDICNQQGIHLFSISFMVNNILDTAYQSHLSRLKYAPENLANNRSGVFNMGRNFSLSLRVPFVLKKAA